MCRLIVLSLHNRILDAVTTLRCKLIILKSCSKLRMKICFFRIISELVYKATSPHIWESYEIVVI